MEAKTKTCFVIIGFGLKMDYTTGREIDLDKTFEYIIKPVFDDLGYLCFRASEISHSGVIDVPMFHSILRSDFVVADISTLNPNVLYELGVRHAVRKNTTIVISENELKYPFDLNHMSIESYEHLGKAIDFGEVGRFRDLLKKKVKALEEAPQIDSPLYTLFPHLQVPRFTEEEIEEIKENIKEDSSLSDYISAAEKAKNNNDFVEAEKQLLKALELGQDNILVTQRLALIAYKAGTPSKFESLKKALQILEPLNPTSTTDLETLGLSGAIYKRLYEIERRPEYLQQAVWFYEKGFYVGSDYYNGINLAYLLNVSASIEEDKYEAITSYIGANRIRKRVKEICESHINSPNWKSREDKEWILLTLAEVAFAFRDITSEKIYIQDAANFMEGDFALRSYTKQREKLKELLVKFKF